MLVEKVREKASKMMNSGKSMVNLGNGLMLETGINLYQRCREELGTESLRFKDGGLYTKALGVTVVRDNRLYISDTGWSYIHEYEGLSDKELMQLI